MDESKRKDSTSSNDQERASRKRPTEDVCGYGGKRASKSGAGGATPERLRPRSAPPPPAQDDLKRAALSRIFQESADMALKVRRLVEELSDRCESESGDEEDDPLLSSVPSNLDPERLGFLVCAQETLRYLYRRGIPHDHAIFTHLRTRFIRGLNQMGLD